MVSKTDINDFARRLNNVNKNLWKAVYEAEALMRNEVFTECSNANGSEENFKKLAIAYKKFNKGDEDFADMEHFGASFRELKEFVDKLSEIDE